MLTCLRLATPTLDHLFQILVNNRKIPLPQLFVLAHHLPINPLRQFPDVQWGIHGLGGAEGEDEVFVREGGEEAVCVVSVGGGRGGADFDVGDGEVCLASGRGEAGSGKKSSRED